MARTPEMMTAARAAQFLGVDRKTLRKWIRCGVGPPRQRLGKRLWFSRQSLVEWLKGGAFALPSVRAEFARVQPVAASERRGNGAHPWPLPAR